MSKESVNHPAHYGGDVPHETWKCLNAWGLEGDALLWNAVKYISRAGKKDQTKTIEDLEKAKWYLEKRIELLKSVIEVTHYGMSVQIRKASDPEPLRPPK